MNTVSVHAVLFANNDECIVKVPQCIKLLLHVQMRRYHNGPKKLQLWGSLPCPQGSWKLSLPKLRMMVASLDPSPSTTALLNTWNTWQYFIIHLNIHVHFNIKIHFVAAGWVVGCLQPLPSLKYGLQWHWSNASIGNLASSENLPARYSITPLSQW